MLLVTREDLWLWRNLDSSLESNSENISQNEIPKFILRVNLEFNETTLRLTFTNRTTIDYQLYYFYPKVFITCNVPNTNQYRDFEIVPSLINENFILTEENILVGPALNILDIRPFGHSYAELMELELLKTRPLIKNEYKTVIGLKWENEIFSKEANDYINILTQSYFNEMNGFVDKRFFYLAVRQTNVFLIDNETTSSFIIPDIGN